MRARGLFAIAGAALLSACASVPASAPPAGTTAVVAVQPTAVHWARSSAEHRAIFIQTYRAAADQLRGIVADRGRGTWAVIIDADETVLDNSEYQRRLAERGTRFDVNTWNDWVREGTADSLPGAAGFIRTVRELGGRVAIVTNRDDVVCPETRANLQRLTISVDAVLCQAAGESGKSGRFQAVRDGTTGAGLPALDVVMYIGDNIHDFPDQTQQLRTGTFSAFDNFGRTWFILPNPMYGSWERNPPR